MLMQVHVSEASSARFHSRWAEVQRKAPHGLDTCQQHCAYFLSLEKVFHKAFESAHMYSGLIAGGFYASGVLVVVLTDMQRVPSPHAEDISSAWKHADLSSSLVGLMHAVTLCVSFVFASFWLACT